MSFASIDAQVLATMAGWSLAAIAVTVAWVIWRRLRRADEFSRLARIAAQHSSDGVVLQRADGTIIWCNAAYCKITQRPRGFWIGRKPQKWVFPPETMPTDAEIDAFRYDPDDPGLGTLLVRENMRADGSRFWNQHSVSPILKRDKAPLFVLVCRDVTEQVEREEALAKVLKKLERAVNYDALTGLGNRRLLMQVLDDALATHADGAGQVGLMHMDLDRFKDINDTHGHAAGDAVLIRAAEILTAVARPGDLTARIGGDEFILVSPGLHRAAEFQAQAQDILSRVDTPIVWEGINLTFGASLGLAIAPPGTCSSEDLIQRADFALYEVKSQGRGRAQLYDAPMRKKHVERKGLADELAEAIRSHGLDFHYQPILDAGAMRIVGFEALARWNHPKRGLISPAGFLQTVEDIGLLEELDLSAMQAAVETQAHLRSHGLGDMYVSFNAAFVTLSNANLVDHLSWAAEAHDVPRDRIVVEVLETVLFGSDASNSRVARQIQGLTRAGFLTRLDDFGVGHAGLAHLAQLDIEGIKIDRSLITTLTRDPTSQVIVRAILSLARDLQLGVVAEGVEDAGLARHLVAEGCGSLQGYGIARPMPRRQLTDWVRRFDPSLFLSDAAAPERQDLDTG